MVTKNAVFMRAVAFRKLLCIIKKEEELIMSRQKTQHTRQFKLDAINYRKEHPDLTQVECTKNL